MSAELAHWVMLGDVVDSREISDRASFRDTLEAALDHVNHIYGSDLYADFAGLRGVDEVGGVLTRPDNMYRILRTINNHIYPKQVRFAVVRGEIDVGSPAQNITELDGPAFHRAAELLEEVERTGLSFGMEGGNNQLNPLLANQINLLSLLRASWTKKQIEALMAYERTGSQTNAAAELEVTQQTLSERLRSINWRQINHAETILNDAFSEYLETIPSQTR